LGKLLHCPLLRQGFTYSPVSIDLRVSWVKFLAGKGLGFLFFIPVILELGGLKVPSTFGIKDLLVIHELNLCLSITTRTYTYCDFVLSSEVQR
jgi:hypothetical protein